MKTVDDIVAHVEGVLAEGRGMQRVGRVLQYLRDIHAKRDQLGAQARRIRKRNGQIFFATLGNLSHAQLVLDARIHGRNVGEVAFEPEGDRTFTPDASLPSPGWTSEKWESPKGKKFLRDVTPLVEKTITEALVQSAAFVAMARKARVGKPTPLHGHQPVLVHRFPFQFLMPLSASKKVPEVPKRFTLGHADILARAGEGTRHASACSRSRSPGEERGRRSRRRWPTRRPRRCSCDSTAP